jgi:4-diphosphocytidyl-2-C-methyl-D-erythritol kinase
MEEFKIKTPAKINLGLNVISRRDDGYHNIETIFYPVDLFDSITFKKSSNFIFNTDNTELKGKPDNLIIKAKKLLEEATKKEMNVHINLEKKIPIGAGLGGGSSDAASSLLGLNNLYNLNLDFDKLFELALILGSDVPFFLNPKPCYASSRGEKLEMRKLKINYPILVVNTGIHISTKWAYSNITPKTPKFSLINLTQEYLDAPDKLSGILRNDFEEIVFKNYPELKKLKDELNETGSLFTLMTGSGSTLFSIFKDNSSAEKIKEKLEMKYFVFLQRCE